MLQNFFKSKYFYIILASLTAVILLMVFLNTNNSRTPVLISASPKNGFSSLPIKGSIMLQFSTSSEGLSIVSIPEAIWEVVPQGDYIVEIRPTKQLNQNTPYSLNLLWKNKSLGTLNYKTEVTQTDHDLIEDIKDEVARDYPLASRIPYQTPDFKVTYASALTLQIALKNNSISQEAAISQVKSWVSSNGGDVEKHKYTVVPFTN